MTLTDTLVIEDALTLKEVAACNEAIDHESDRVRERPPEESLAGGSRALKGKQGRGDLGEMLTWPQPYCQPFRDLLAHRRIVPPLQELLGEGFRLDHVYGIVMRKGAEGTSFMAEGLRTISRASSSSTTARCGAD